MDEYKIKHVRNYYSVFSPTGRLVCNCDTLHEAEQEIELEEKQNEKVKEITYCKGKPM